MNTKVKVLLLFLAFIVVNAMFAQQIPLPSKNQIRWQKYEHTMFIHFSPATWQGKEFDDLSYPISKINPTLLNTDQWCEVAKLWDAKMIVFVAKHVGGFCWWQTNTTEYSVKNTPWRGGKGDVLRDLSESCKKYGLDLGVYLYPGDPAWGAGIGSGGKTEDPTKQEAYNKIYRQQLTEVLSKYGSMKEVWFDGNCHIPVKDILEKYAKEAVIYQGKQADIRWSGNEDGVAPYPNWYTIKKEDLATGYSTALQSDVNGDAYAPIETDIPLLKNGTHKWFWAPNTDKYILTLDQLMNAYYKTSGRGSVFLINATPDTTGLIPMSHVKRYKEFGLELRKRFGQSLGKTSGKGKEVMLNFEEPTDVNHCIIRERLENGQRVKSYVLEGYSKERQWFVLSKGSSIGLKRIDFFKNVRVEKIRLTVLDCKAEPVISELSAYNVRGKFMEALKSNTKPILISSWENDTYSENEWKELVLDLTPYVTQVGVYDVSFNLISYDYLSKKATGLIFKDWELEMYGKNYPEGLTRIDNSSVFRVTRSQQSLNEYPTYLKVKVRRNPAASSGEITINRVEINK